METETVSGTPLFYIYFSSKNLRVIPGKNWHTRKKTYLLHSFTGKIYLSKYAERNPTNLSS